MKKIDTVIFDLDGTLVDTRPHTVTCVNYALSLIGENSIDRKTITGAIGPTLADTFRSILAPSKWTYIDQCVSFYRAYQQDHPQEAFKEIQLYPMVKETLQKLFSYNFAVATSKPVSLANEILALTGLKQYFITVIGIDDVSKNKPAPDMIYLALSRLQALRAAMIVGDTVEDIKAGKNAQILTCAVDYGYTEREQLVDTYPDFLISKFSDLLAILE
jgi:pyrophosphatase PpaX